MYVGVVVSEQMVKKIDNLIKAGYVKSRSEFLRVSAVDRIRSMEAQEV